MKLSDFQFTETPYRPKMKFRWTVISRWYALLCLNGQSKQILFYHTSGFSLKIRLNPHWHPTIFPLAKSLKYSLFFHFTFNWRVSLRRVSVSESKLNTAADTGKSWVRKGNTVKSCHVTDITYGVSIHSAADISKSGTAFSLTSLSQTPPGVIEISAMSQTPRRH